MKRILQRQETATLSMSNLRKALPHYCKIVRYDTMKGKTLKQALGGKKVMIVLWNLHDIKHRVLNKPGHFFAISVLQGAPVVFSSTGWSPMKEAIITHSDISILNNLLPSTTMLRCNYRMTATRAGGIALCSVTYIDLSI